MHIVDNTEPDRTLRRINRRKTQRLLFINARRSDSAVTDLIGILLSHLLRENTVATSRSRLQTVDLHTVEHTDNLAPQMSLKTLRTLLGIEMKIIIRRSLNPRDRTHIRAPDNDSLMLTHLLQIRPESISTAVPPAHTAANRIETTAFFKEFIIKSVNMIDPH